MSLHNHFPDVTTENIGDFTEFVINDLGESPDHSETLATTLTTNTTSKQTFSRVYLHDLGDVQDIESNFFRVVRIGSVNTISDPVLY